MTTQPGPTDDEMRAMCAAAYRKERARGCTCEPDIEIVGVEPNAGEDLVPAARVHHDPKCDLRKKQTSANN